MDTRTGIKLGKAFLFRFHRRVNSKGVTVVASTGLHFRAFHLLISAASHDLKETIDKDDSDSLSVSYGMEPEQEALSIVSFKD